MYDFLLSGRRKQFPQKDLANIVRITRPMLTMVLKKNGHLRIVERASRQLWGRPPAMPTIFEFGEEEEMTMAAAAAGDGCCCKKSSINWDFIEHFEEASPMETDDSKSERVHRFWQNANRSWEEHVAGTVADAAAGKSKKRKHEQADEAVAWVEAEAAERVPKRRH